MAERGTASQKAACGMVCEAVMRLDKQINGNGQPGIRQELQALADEAHTFFVTNTTQRSAEIDFHNKRDREIKDALAKHYADAQLVNLEISNKLARRNMWAAWVAVFVGIASLAIVIGIFYVSNWVIHHG